MAPRPHLRPAAGRPPCPFYGMSQVGSGVMLDTGGNQCALISSHAACQMELAALAPNWTVCVFYFRPGLVEDLDRRGVRVFPAECQPAHGDDTRGVALGEWAEVILALPGAAAQ